MIKFLMVFTCLSLFNVIFSTIRSITTIKSGKTIASLVSGGYFAFYNIMLIYTVADFPIWQKCVITFICNVLGVWVVKFIEEKMKKDKLWKIEVTIPQKYLNAVHVDLKEVPHSYIDIGKYVIFNFYCATQKESQKVKDIVNQYDAKYFVSENKTL